MKYIDEVIKVNADNENYADGIRLELTNIEIEIIRLSLENCVDTDDNPIYKAQKEMLEKFKHLSELKNNGYLKNIDID